MKFVGQQCLHAYFGGAGNGVFEPGERVEVAPAWRNDGLDATSLQGSAAAFSGPEGATYGLVHAAADYGVLDPGQIAGCLENEVCYHMEIDAPAVRRRSTGRRNSTRLCRTIRSRPGACTSVTALSTCRA